MENKNSNKTKFITNEENIIIENLDVSSNKHIDLSHRKSLGNELYTDNILIDNEETEGLENDNIIDKEDVIIAKERKLSTISNKSKKEYPHLTYARLLYLCSNLLFVLSSITMKLLIMHNDKGGKLSFAFLRYSTVALYFAFNILNKENFDWFRTDFLDSSMLNLNDGKITTILKISNIYNFNNKSKFWILTRSICLCMMTVCVILSFKYIKFSISNAIFMISPILNNFIASVLTTEPFLKKYLYSCIISFVGIIIICIGNNSSQHNSQHNSSTTTDIQNNDDSFIIILNTIIGTIIVITNACLVATANTVFKIITNIDETTINFVSSFYSSILLLIYEIVTIFFLDFPSYYDGTLIILGIINGIGIGLSFHLMAESFKYSTISQTSFMMYSQLPTSVIIGYLFFNEHLSIVELIGISIIIINTVYVSIFVK